MARSIIVTGGFGFLGRAVAEALSISGAKVARVDYAAGAATPLKATLDIGGIDLVSPAARAVNGALIPVTHGG